jgi:hypothetical protein
MIKKYPVHLALLPGAKLLCLPQCLCLISSARDRRFFGKLLIWGIAHIAIQKL